MSRIDQPMTFLARVEQRPVMLGFVGFGTLSGSQEIVYGPHAGVPATAGGTTFDDPRKNLSTNRGGTSLATIIVGMDMGSLSAASMPQPR